MIIKASQRSGARQLAQHLLSAENEHITVHEITGASSDNLTDALQEMQAISRATRCKKFLFSVSLNPPAHAQVKISEFEDALSRVEEKLGLQGQPRCVVFHEKEGRRHAHCVWSRIDATNMKAIKLDYYKKRLNGLAKDLFLEHGWELPQGFSDKRLRNPRNFTLAEWQQARRARISPQMIKAKMQQCWQRSDSQAAFTAALHEAGFTLARGDRRGYVAVDWRGEIYSLTKATGQKSKALKAKLGDPQTLPTITEAHAQIQAQQNALKMRLQQDLAQQQRTQAAPLKAKLKALVKAQRAERQELEHSQDQRRIAEAKARQAKLRKGLRGLWDWLTGAQRKTKQRNDELAQRAQERDQHEWDSLISQQLTQRQALQQPIKTLREQHQQQRQKLHTTFTNNTEPQRTQRQLNNSTIQQP